MSQHKFPKPPPPPLVQQAKLPISPEAQQWLVQRAAKENMAVERLVAMLLDIGVSCLRGFDHLQAVNPLPMQPMVMFEFNDGRRIQVIAMYVEAQAGLILPESARRKLN